MVQANIRAKDAKNAAGEVFNIAIGSSITLDRLIRVLQQIPGATIDPVYTDAYSGDVIHSRVDISKAEWVLGFRLEFTLEEGLKRTVQ